MKAKRLEKIIRSILCVSMPAAGLAIAAGQNAACFSSCPDGPSSFTRTYPLSDFADAGAEDGGPIDLTNCNDLCAKNASFGVNSCKFVKDEAGADAVECTFPSVCEGRRPAGIASRPRPQGASIVGRFFARVAHNEAASVAAFHVLRDELEAHGAPKRLIRAAMRSARDEIRHARLTTALARRYGAMVNPPQIEKRPLRNLEEIALENALEGCVRETYGALVASHQAIAASDPMVREVMRKVAQDEIRHAALGWEVARWAQKRLNPAARERVAAARRTAMQHFAAEARQALPKELIDQAGLPQPAHAEALLAALEQALGAV